MKKLFRGYYKLTDTEIQNIWDNGFISLDTNVLFNIYRYSDETRRDLIKVIKKYSSQLWLTNHSAFEFHKNRISVISDQIVVYDETIKTFNKLENDIIKNLKTPHLSKSVLKQFEKTIKSTTKDLEKKKVFYKKLLSNDTILTKISTIFNNKVGDAFTTDEIVKIEKEGEERYKKKIPPGYKDNEKNENKYGDLIIWKELIKKAKSDNRPFILIIDDIKEDWWLRTQGQTISPRQELAQELYKEAQQVFHLYTPDRFLEFAAKTETVKQETIDEVREIRSERIDPFTEIKEFNKYLTVAPSFKDIYNFSDSFKNIGSFKNTFSSIVPSAELFEAIKKNQFFTNLSDIEALRKFQDTFKSIGELATSRPLAEAYLKSLAENRAIEKPKDGEGETEKND